MSSGKAGLGGGAVTVGVGGADVGVAVRRGAGARVLVGGTVAETAGRPDGVSVAVAAGVAVGTPGAEGESQAQALTAMMSAIEPMRIREGFMGIYRPGRTNAGQYSVTIVRTTNITLDR